MLFSRLLKVNNIFFYLSINEITISIILYLSNYLLKLCTSLSIYLIYPTIYLSVYLVSNIKLVTPGRRNCTTQVVSIYLCVYLVSNIKLATPGRRTCRTQVGQYNCGQHTPPPRFYYHNSQDFTLRLGYNHLEQKVIDNVYFGWKEGVNTPLKFEIGKAFSSFSQLPIN